MSKPAACAAGFFLSSYASVWNDSGIIQILEEEPIWHIGSTEQSVCAVTTARLNARSVRSFTWGPDAALFPDIDAEFAAEEKLDTPVKTADTIEQLPAELGIASAALRGTVERYNRFCAQGHDEDFCKRPETLRPISEGPFYAVYGKVATDGAFGGVLVNANTEVFRADRSGVIPGLFAAGDNAAGWARRAGKGEERLMVCNECNWAISSGFAAGKAAASYCGA